MAEITTRGTCSFCGKSFSQRGIGRHLVSCKARKAAMQEPLGVGRGKPRTTTIYHLKIAGTYLPYYWMHIEIPGDQTLYFLDSFLRDTWLECCGHLSAFTINGVDYMSMRFEDYPEDKDMKVRLQEVLSPGLSFQHQYDFGTTTHLTLKVIDEREGQVIGRDVLHVMARNDPPPLPCDVCGKPARWVCSMCLWDWESEETWLCDDCAPRHACGEEMLMPVANSPRVGVCGYVG